MIRDKINHISAFQIYQILKYGSSILISIGLAKSYLSLSEVGIFESLVFYSSSISFFWITGISQGLLTQFPKTENANNLRNTMYFSAFISFLSLSILAVTIVFVVNRISHLQFLNSIPQNGCTLFILYSIFNPATFLAEFILLLEKKFNKLIIYGIFTAILPVLIISIPAFLHFSLYWCLIGLLIWTIIKFLYLSRLVNQYSILRINYKEIINLFKFSAPLIITALLAGSASYIDSLIINIKFDISTFAVFRYGAREFPLFLLIANALGTSMITQFSRVDRIGQNLEEIKDKSRKMLHFLFPIAIVLLLTSQYLFTWVFSNNFHESYKVFDIYLLLIISRFIFPQTILLGLKKNMLILKISFWELIINVVTSLILVQYFGILGVAYGTVIGYFFEKASLAMFLKVKSNIKPRQYIAFKELFFYSSIMLTIFILKSYP